MFFEQMNILFLFYVWFKDQVYIYKYNSFKNEFKKLKT